MSANNTAKPHIMLGIARLVLGLMLYTIAVGNINIKYPKIIALTALNRLVVDA